MARKRISQQPLLAIFKSSARCEYGVVSATAVDTWRVEQDLDYRIVLGGHTGPVIAVHAVNGAVVRCYPCMHHCNYVLLARDKVTAGHVTGTPSSGPPSPSPGAPRRLHPP